MDSSSNSRPFSFDSKTMTSVVYVGIFLAIFIPVLWVIYRVVKDLRIEHRERHCVASKDLEKGSPSPSPPSTAEMLDSTPANRGLSELEQPAYLELHGDGRAELWGEECAREVCGQGVVWELDAACKGAAVVLCEKAEGDLGLRVLQLETAGVVELDGTGVERDRNDREEKGIL
ncbi:unnamed protein product [Periconia digitata]|uniref:Uncharacterized protein n=1 Tax=Periconia digitata TaxID=1303443 RepID=A0A9W4XDM3_9PLEO|nr:unnamed protein product [Periconia digitata]